MCLQQNKEKFSKRAKRKFLHLPTVNHLIQLNSPLKKAYVSTLYCGHKISVCGGESRSRYCKRTWCAVCAPIRTAVRINNYKQQLENLGDLQLTTLTIPNVQAGKIRQAIAQFRFTFKQFRNSYKKRSGNVFRGVYNFEITYNSRTKLFHPHIHIIHECIPMDKKTREQHSGKLIKGQYHDEYYNELITYWLDHIPQASIKAQDTRVCFDLIEGFKYQSLSIYKIKTNHGKEPVIPVKELDTIYQAIFGVRCFQPFGINKISDKQEEALMDDLEATETSAPDGEYCWNINDWVSVDGLPLSGFVPTKKLLDYTKKLQLNAYYT